MRIRIPRTELTCSGDDTLFGSASNDVLFGSGGNDGLFGEAGRDQLSGNNGDDILVGGDEDVLRGHGGKDILIGGEAFDILIGGGNTDLLIAASTSFEIDLAALDSIMAEWLGPGYFQRINNLIDGTGSPGGGLKGSLFLPNIVIADY